MDSELKNLMRKIQERQAMEVANGTAFVWKIELCLPEIGCNETIERIARTRDEAIRCGRSYAATMNIKPARILARKETK